MPFFAANFSHFVFSFGGGRGFSRGSGKVGGGSVSRTPSVGVLIMAQVVRSWFIRACAQSRAVEEMSLGVGWGGSGLGSWRRRRPRSKV